MKLSLSVRHIYYINAYTTSYSLKRKFETALAETEATSVEVNTSKAEYMDVYAAISAQPEGYAARINREIEAETLPQLMAAMDPAHPDHAEVAELLTELQAIKTARGQTVEETIATQKLFFDKLNPNYVEPPAEQPAIIPLPVAPEPEPGN